MRIKKRKLPTVFDLKAVGEALQDTPGALAYWAFQNQPPQLYSPAWNRAKAGVLSSDNYPGAEELSTAGTGTEDAGNWTPGNAALLTNTIAGILRVARNAVNNPDARQIMMVIGQRYRIKCQARSGGGAVPRVRTAATIFWTGTAATDWQDVDIEIIADANNIRLQSSTVIGTEYTEWRNLSIRDANPLNLDLVSVTIGEPGQGNIPYVYDFDAVNDYATFSAPGITALDAIFDGDEMSLMAWASVDNWADAASRAVIRLLDDGSNDMMLNKAAGAGVFRWYGLSGGTTNQVSIGTGSPPGLNMYNMTRSLNADELIAYLNNAQIGATQNGLVAWSGGGFDIAGSLIGAITTAPLWPWGGGMAFAALFDQPITQAQNNRIYEAGR